MANIITYEQWKTIALSLPRSEHAVGIHAEKCPYCEGTGLYDNSLQESYATTKELYLKRLQAWLAMTTPHTTQIQSLPIDSINKARLREIGVW